MEKQEAAGTAAECEPPYAPPGGTGHSVKTNNPKIKCTDYTHAGCSISTQITVIQLKIRKEFLLYFILLKLLRVFFVSDLDSEDKRVFAVELHLIRKFLVSRHIRDVTFIHQPENIHPLTVPALSRTLQDFTGELPGFRLVK